MSLSSNTFELCHFRAKIWQKTEETGIISECSHYFFHENRVYEKMKLRFAKNLKTFKEHTQLRFGEKFLNHATFFDVSCMMRLPRRHIL